MSNKEDDISKILCYRPREAMTNYDEYRKRNHSLRDRFGENGCQASAVLSRCERAGGRQGRGVKRRWGASVIKLGTSSVLIFCKSKPNEASSEPNRESLDSPTVYTEKRRCQVKSPIISKNFIIGPYPHLSENSVIGPYPHLSEDSVIGPFPTHP